MTAGNVSLPGFDTPNLAASVEALGPDDIDRLPFGAIRLDPEGVVRLYSATERQQSGYKSRPAVGLNLFFDIAPCMDTPELRGRVEAARQTGAVDIEMGWVGDFADRDREVTIRIQSASDGGIWIFIRRDDAGPLPLHQAEGCAPRPAPP